MPSLASEFPNDNPRLHGGGIWMNQDVVGGPTFEPPPRSASVVPTLLASAIEADGAPPILRAPCESGIVLVGDEDHGPSWGVTDGGSEGEREIVVEELEPLDPGAIVVEAVQAPLRVGPSIASTARTASTRAATSLPAPPDDAFVSFVTTLEGVAIHADAPHVAALVRALLLESAIGPIAEDVRACLREGAILDARGIHATFAAASSAWAAILRGTSEDFGACGAMMLDEWAADLLARLLAKPDRTAGLRRELRARGVAAFGIVEAA